MNDKKRNKRHDAIAQAAYDVIAERGFAGASLLNIAKAASASNETMYRWYENKVGLFKILVEDNAAEVQSQLEAALRDGTEGREALAHISPILLKMLLSDRAILLNRAAAGDPSGELGAALAQAGRETIAPLMHQVIGRIAFPAGKTAEEVGELYLSLLIGDLQIRRVIGVLDVPNDTFIAERTQKALRALEKLI